MSARARFLVFLLCVLNISSLDVFEGRERAVVVVDGWEEEDWARRVESWDVNAREVEETGISLVGLRPALGRGTP